MSTPYKNKKSLQHASYAYLSTLHWLLAGMSFSTQPASKTPIKINAKTQIHLYSNYVAQMTRLLLYLMWSHLQARGKLSDYLFKFGDLGELLCWMLMYCLDYLHLIADKSQRSISEDLQRRWWKEESEQEILVSAELNERLTRIQKHWQTHTIHMPLLTG